MRPTSLGEVAMHIHQYNHWNDIIFYWYQSYHWCQWTIGLTNRICLCILHMCEMLGVKYISCNMIKFIQGWHYSVLRVPCSHTFPFHTPTLPLPHKNVHSKEYSYMKHKSLKFLFYRVLKLEKNWIAILYPINSLSSRASPHRHRHIFIWSHIQYIVHWLIPNN